MHINTVGELRRQAKEVKHNLPDLSVLGSHLETGLHGGVFKYDDDKILKIGSRRSKKRMQNMLGWLKQNHKHIAKLIDFGDFGEDYWTLIEFIPFTLSAQDVRYLQKVRCAAHKRKGWFGYISKAPHEVKQMGPQWVSLCSFLHRAKYWHDDLHYGNVRKTDDGTIKLIDLESFGWAGSIDYA